jgi:murein DD-endopeptidase MepM/ murein hydrolase activator NlpD
MVKASWSRWRRSLETLFPERHLYLRSSGEVRGLVLTTNRQFLIACAVGFIALWTGMGTASMLMGLLSASPAEQAAIHERAYYERLMADTRARLNSAVAQLNDSNGSIGQLVAATEKRHEALAMLLTEDHVDGGLAASLKPAPLAAFSGQSPVNAITAIRNDQDRLIAQAETYAKTRADRLRTALRLAGLGDGVSGQVSSEHLGGPLIDAKDPRALAAILDVDPGFAERIQHVATDLSDAHELTSATDELPLSRPTQNTEQTSGFGVRADPFNGRPAFHAGQDFAGPIGTAIRSTAPGIISFTGVRTGYGNTIEIDHGHGFKTRYAHLSAIGVAVGQHVALGERIGAMGSTGRSTGPHLHYEVWVDGRPQNPKRFLEAGDYVQQTG